MGGAASAPLAHADPPDRRGRLDNRVRFRTQDQPQRMPHSRIVLELRATKSWETGVLGPPLPTAVLIKIGSERSDPSAHRSKTSRLILPPLSRRSRRGRSRWAARQRGRQRQPWTAGRRRRGGHPRQQRRSGRGRPTWHPGRKGRGWRARTGWCSWTAGCSEFQQSRRVEEFFDSRS